MTAIDDWQVPADWPINIDAPWRLTELKEAAKRIVAMSDVRCILEVDGPASMWLSVHREDCEIARVFVNRSLDDKTRCKYTLIAGAAGDITDCRSISKLAFLVNQARGGLLDSNPASLFPRTLRYLQPLAERGDRVRSDFDLEKTIANLTLGERGDLVEAYRSIAERNDLGAIDRWVEEHPLDGAAGKLENLLFLLDGLARSGEVPADVARYQLVTWDERTHDDAGNEW